MTALAKFLPLSATGAMAANTIVRFTANRGEVTPATAATDKIAGVLALGASAAGDMVDVAYEGVHEVVAGGTIAAGDPLTTNASGQAIVATFAAGQMRHVIGFALVPAVAGDVFRFQIQRQVIAG